MVRVSSVCAVLFAFREVIYALCGVFFDFCCAILALWVVLALFAGGCLFGLWCAFFAVQRVLCAQWGTMFADWGAFCALGGVFFVLCV